MRTAWQTEHKCQGRHQHLCLLTSVWVMMTIYTHTHTCTHTGATALTNQITLLSLRRGLLERQSYTRKEAVQWALCVFSLFVQTPLCHHHCQQFSLLSFVQSHGQGGKQTTHTTEVICFTLNHNILPQIRKYFIAAFICKWQFIFLPFVIHRGLKNTDKH